MKVDIATLNLAGASAILLRRGCRIEAVNGWPKCTPRLPIFVVDEIDDIRAVTEEDMLAAGWTRARPESGHPMEAYSDQYGYVLKDMESFIGEVAGCSPKGSNAEIRGIELLDRLREAKARK